MFLDSGQIQKALQNIQKIHPFYGITFLTAKLGKLPEGKAIPFDFKTKETEFLETYLKPNPHSQSYCQIFRSPKRWVASDYPKSLLSARTRGNFAKVFIHPKKTDEWGFKTNYLEILQNLLSENRTEHGLIPALDLAIWLYRDHEWSNSVSSQGIIQHFFTEFNISDPEQQRLFYTSDLDHLSLQPTPITWEDLKRFLGTPPDGYPEETGTLQLLEIQGVGPAKHILFQPGKRLTIITGDNGLGKTFILDCAWWALTGKWAGLPAYPLDNPRSFSKKNESIIGFQISDHIESEMIKVPYNWQTQSWNSPPQRPTIPGLLLYARVDGSFAVWDPAKEYLALQELRDSDLTPRPYVFTSDEVWNGRNIEIRGRTTTFINGLLQDWIQWQSNPQNSPFVTLKKVLERLSPPFQSELGMGDLGILRPGEPVRIPYDVRLIPTIEHSYGQIPIVYTSAGVRRIITLAYLIVWAWEEHKIQSELIRQTPQKKMVILIDELEAHLHPQWQRLILSALLEVNSDLTSELEIQIIVATHSPMVLASVESSFKDKIDKLFHLNLVRSDLFSNEVELRQLPFIRQGRIDAWLTSEVFGLRQPRSLEGEKAIQAAKNLQEQENPNSEAVKKVSEQLRHSLAEDDEFWPRWLFFARQHGALL